MNCKDCAYYWKNDDDDFAQCHWENRCPGDMPPCEYEEENENLEGGAY